MIVAVLTGVIFSVLVCHFFQRSIVFTHVLPVITQFFPPLFSIWWEKLGEKRFLSGDNGFNWLTWVRNRVMTSVTRYFLQLYAQRRSRRTRPALDEPSSGRTLAAHPPHKKWDGGDQFLRVPNYETGSKKTVYFQKGSSFQKKAIYFDMKFYFEISLLTQLHRPVDHILVLSFEFPFHTKCE
jgi:hypothetical protein